MLAAVAKKGGGAADAAAGTYDSGMKYTVEIGIMDQPEK